MNSNNNPIIIKEIFLKILDNYLKEYQVFVKKRQRTISTYENNQPSSYQEYITPSLLRNDLPTEISKAVDLGNDYKIKGSSGVGNMAEVPHVCIFKRRITTSAEHGYYIVYLFDSVEKKVHLSLNQGFTEYKKIYGTKQGKIKIRENAFAAQKLLQTVDGFDFEPIQWSVKNDLANGYKNGNICSKEYNVDNFPGDNTLIHELKNLINVYSHLEGLVGTSIFDLNTRVMEDAFQEAIQNPYEADIPVGPISKRPEKMGIPKAMRSGNRDANMSAKALKEANYKCENSSEHATFLTKHGHQFMEAHHLIPLEFREEFKYELDVPENIISLCPNCHRAFHHSNDQIKSGLIDRFLKIRSVKLEARGILIEASKLKKYYTKIENSEL